MSANLRRVIESSLAIPYGSVSAERAFSHMNLVKTLHRSVLKLEVVDAEMRIDMHPDPLGVYDADESTQEYKKTSKLCD